VIFSEALANARALLEPGTPVMISVEGERDGDTLKLRAQTIDSLDAAANGVQRGLKVVLDHYMVQANSQRLEELKRLLKPGGKGIIQLALQLDDRGREVEIAMPGHFDISPAQKGALSTVPGVLEVLEI
jgi:DNA polymerase-3 subunit alpha